MKIKGYYLSFYDLDELREVALFLEAEGFDDISQEVFSIIDSSTPIELLIEEKVEANEL